MINFKTWSIPHWTPEDIDWLEDLKLSFEIIQTDSIPMAIGAKTFMIAGRRIGLKIITDTREQETMLRLRFEPRLNLLTSIVEMDD